MARAMAATPVVTDGPYAQAKAYLGGWTDWTNWMLPRVLPRLVTTLPL
jgi:hypothetical protein